MGEKLGAVIAIVFVAGCIAVLGAIIRFSIVSPQRTRGMRDRLHHPDLAKIEAQWSVTLPRALESLYKSDLVQSSEVYLAGPGEEAKRWWHIYQFIPLTSRDLSEWIKITGVPGLPIAIDGNKGTYYMPLADLKAGKAPPVLFRPPGRKGTDVEVAASIEEFMEFQQKGSTKS